MKKTAYLAPFTVAICAVTVILAGIIGKVIINQRHASSENSAFSPVPMPETTNIEIDSKRDDNTVSATLFYGNHYFLNVYDYVVANGGSVIDRKISKGFVVYDNGKIRNVSATLTAICSESIFTFMIKNSETGEIIEEKTFESEDLSLKDYMSGNPGVVVPTTMRVKTKDVMDWATMYYVRDHEGDSKTISLWSKHESINQWQITDPNNQGLSIIERPGNGYFVYGHGGAWMLNQDNSVTPLLTKTRSDSDLFVAVGWLYTSDDAKMAIGSYVNEDGSVDVLLYNFYKDTYELVNDETCNYVAASGNFLIEKNTDGQYYGWFFKDPSLKPISQKIRIEEDKVFHYTTAANMLNTKTFLKAGWTEEDIELFANKVKSDELTYRSLYEAPDYKAIPSMYSVVLYDESEEFLPNENLLCKKIYDEIGDFVIFGENDVILDDFHCHSLASATNPADSGATYLKLWSDEYGDLSSLEKIDRIREIDDGSVLAIIDDRNNNQIIVHQARDGKIEKTWTSEEERVFYSGVSYTNERLVGRKLDDGSIVIRNGYSSSESHWTILHEDGTVEIVDEEPVPAAPDTSETPLKSGVSLCSKKQPQIGAVFLCLVFRLRGENPRIRRIPRRS